MSLAVYFMPMVNLRFDFCFELPPLFAPYAGAHLQLLCEPRSVDVDGSLLGKGEYRCAVTRDQFFVLGQPHQLMESV